MSYLDIVDEYIAKKNELRAAEEEHGHIADHMNALRREVRGLAAAIGHGSEPHLSQRQHQVVRKLAEGGTNETIGKELHISPETVRTHVRTACDRLGATGRAHLIHLAHQKGMLS